MLTVSFDELPAVTEVGLTETVTPAGAPDAVRATDWAEPLVTAVLMVDVVPEPGFTAPEAGESDTEKSLTGGGVVPPPLVNGSKVWLNCHVLCAMPEQLSEPLVPTQPPLSRCNAQNDSVLMPLDAAQFSIVVRVGGGEGFRGAVVVDAEHLGDADHAPTAGPAVLDG